MCRQLEPWQHWRCCSLGDRVTDTSNWFFSLFIVNKDPKGSKTFSLFGPSVFLPFLCLFPLLALFSVIPSAPSPSLGEPGASTGASWALLLLKNFLLPPVLLLVFCSSQFLFFFSQSGGFVTKQSYSWGLHIDFVKEQGNMPRDLLHTNTLLWWGGRWSSSRTVWGSRLLHSFVSPSPLLVMPFYLDMSENDVQGKLEKHIQKRIV